MTVEARQGVPESTHHGQYVICPWCKAEHGDCWEWVTDRPSEMTCEGCGGTFAYWADYDVTYSANPRTPPPPPSAPVRQRRG